MGSLSSVSGLILEPPIAYYLHPVTHAYPYARTLHLHEVLASIVTRSGDDFVFSFFMGVWCVVILIPKSDDGKHIKIRL